MAEGIRRDDDRWIEQLYSVFQAGFRYRLLRQLGPEGIDDHVHGVMVAVIQAVRAGRLEQPERLVGFANTILRRHISHEIEARVAERGRTTGTEPDFNLPSGQPDPEWMAEKAQAKEIMQNVLVGLRERDREVLRRFYLLEQPEPEIREAMGLSPDQFRNLKNRAKDRFAEKWNAHCARRKQVSRSHTSTPALWKPVRKLA